MSGELQKLKAAENRRPGGRRQGAANKYFPDDELITQWEKSINGKYGQKYEWQLVRELVCSYAKDPVYRKIMKMFMAPKKALLGRISEAIDRKDWVFFKKLGEMFEFAEIIKTREAVDEMRACMLGANNALFILSDASKKCQPSKALLLKLCRQTSPGLFDGKQDADLFKMMRSLGLPRKPDGIKVRRMPVDK
jgi:hypothetical protein